MSSQHGSGLPPEQVVAESKVEATLSFMIWAQRSQFLISTMFHWLHRLALLKVSGDCTGVGYQEAGGDHLGMFPSLPDVDFGATRQPSEGCKEP